MTTSILYWNRMQPLLIPEFFIILEAIPIGKQNRFFLNRKKNRINVLNRKNRLTLIMPKYLYRTEQFI